MNLFSKSKCKFSDDGSWIFKMPLNCYYTCDKMSVIISKKIYAFCIVFCICDEFLEIETCDESESEKYYDR